MSPCFPLTIATSSAVTATYPITPKSGAPSYFLPVAAACAAMPPAMPPTTPAAATPAIRFVSPFGLTKLPAT
jgi:hypothetical protein